MSNFFNVLKVNIIASPTSFTVELQIQTEQILATHDVNITPIQKITSLAPCEVTGDV